MLDKLPFKKEYLLPLAIIIMLVVCYQFALKKTIAAWELNRELGKQIIANFDPSVEPGYLTRKNVNLSRVLSVFHSDSTSLRNNVINRISEIAQREGVRLSAVPLSDPTYQSGVFTVQQLEFEGDFISFEHVLFDLQKSTGLGYVRSVMFYIQGRTQDNTGKLMFRLYLETAR